MCVCVCEREEIPETLATSSLALSSTFFLFLLSSSTLEAAFVHQSSDTPRREKKTLFIATRPELNCEACCCLFVLVVCLYCVSKIKSKQKQNMNMNQNMESQDKDIETGKHEEHETNSVEDLDPLFVCLLIRRKTSLFSFSCFPHICIYLPPGPWKYLSTSYSTQASTTQPLQGTYLFTTKKRRSSPQVSGQAQAQVRSGQVGLQ